MVRDGAVSGPSKGLVQGPIGVCGLPAVEGPELVGQSRLTLDLRRVMDDEQILVINISRGRLGQDNATLLGNLHDDGNRAGEIWFAGISS